MAASLRRVIRLAVPAELDAVLALWARGRSEHAATEDTAADVARVIDAGSLFVAIEDGALIGSLVAAFDGWRGNMYRLVVEPAHRRRGLARALVTAGEASLRERGARRVTALVGRGDTAAEGLWAAAGYTDDVAIGRWVRNL
jgi:ribosomal protein S18 acetylase RimI-like enzyme